MKYKIQIFLILLIFGFSTGVQAADMLPPEISGVLTDKKSVMGQYAAMAADESTAEVWRGILIGADHASDNVHHDNVYVQIDGGPIIYQTTIPAKHQGSGLLDGGLLWQFYSRDDTEITIYASSAWENGLASPLSTPFPIYFLYPQPETCTEQTVPFSDAGPDQIVNVGSVVTLDASQSYDAYGPDNDDLAFVWYCYSAPEATVELSDEGKAPVITFTPNVAGNYYFRATLRDKVDGANFNRSPIAYVRIRAVAELENESFISANAGGTQQAYVGQTVTLDASLSQASVGIISYTWTQQNPLGTEDIMNMSNLLGISLCRGECYLSNFDANDQVDGLDLALLAANYEAISLPNQAVVEFTAGIARPHIFRLTVNDGTQSDSETAIVAVSTLSAEPVLTHPPVDSACIEE